MTKPKTVVLALGRLPDIFTEALGGFPNSGLARHGRGGSGRHLGLPRNRCRPHAGELIERFPPGLGLIENIAAGTDNIDLEAAAEIVWRSPIPWSPGRG